MFSQLSYASLAGLLFSRLCFVVSPTTVSIIHYLTPVCFNTFFDILCFVSFYNVSLIFFKTYVHFANIRAAFLCLEMGFFIRWFPLKKIRRATRPTDNFFQELFFIKLFFELFLLLLHKLHKFLQGS